MEKNKKQAICTVALAVSVTGFLGLAGACGAKTESDNSPAQANARPVAAQSVAPAVATESPDEKEFRDVVEKFMALVEAGKPDEAQKLIGIVEAPPADANVKTERSDGAFRWAEIFSARKYVLLKTGAVEKREKQAVVRAEFSPSDQRGVVFDAEFTVVRTADGPRIADIDFKPRLGGLPSNRPRNDNRAA